MKCPECNVELGKKTGIDIYKHAVNCLHLPDHGPQRILENVEGEEDERSRRIRVLMQAALKGE